MASAMPVPLASARGGRSLTPHLVGAASRGRSQRTAIRRAGISTPLALASFARMASTAPPSAPTAELNEPGASQTPGSRKH
jgi:hypothetical protein